MKSIATLFITIAIASCVYTPAERQFNQEALTGAYAFNKLSEPQHISNCGDDATQIDLFNFVGYMLQKADKASVSQLLGLKKEVDDYFNGLPEEYTNCLYAEPEFLEICTIYGLKETDKMEQITDKIYQYAMGHFIATKKEIHQGNLYWNTYHEYNDAGYLIASFTKKALVTGVEYVE
ncbi:unnamed protein product (macronuclear) [Paramecium tetraurelia]|uniref:Uncharacterized protein n=1 Tax=Paramecium tetraurelia TaxID=5888 RepID=A0C285_PARTE|nr:uncharacterized protein GSPATT00034379001 [Paramecium tetraurelia]CAK64902.1 unnamed protein product [Paramecium tetraurelia]|eukprot:XP_001432299.1 hypothetical protein (macronuclear) [Paramecium tetraurelia strain d4-2]